MRGGGGGGCALFICMDVGISYIIVHLLVLQLCVHAGGVKAARCYDCDIHLSTVGGMYVCMYVCMNLFLISLSVP